MMVKKRILVIMGMTFVSGFVTYGFEYMFLSPMNDVEFSLMWLLLWIMGMLMYLSYELRPLRLT